MAGLKLHKESGESWLEAALRHAAPHGLEGEVQQVYHRHRAKGEDEATAAFHACEEWDVLEAVNDP
jgi:hypothetical protein